jgi:hypothetical protein
MNDENLFSEIPKSRTRRVDESHMTVQFPLLPLEIILKNMESIDGKIIEIS